MRRPARVRRGRTLTRRRGGRAGERLKKICDLPLVSGRLALAHGHDRREVTLLLGMPVNVAARLEGAAAPGEILASPTTLALLGDTVVACGRPPLALKGVSAPVSACAIEPSPGPG